MYTAAVQKLKFMIAFFPNTHRDYCWHFSGTWTSCRKRNDQAAKFAQSSIRYIGNIFVAIIVAGVSQHLCIYCGYQGVKHSARGYKLVAENMDWDSASKYCQSQFNMGSLIVVRNQTIQYEVVEYVENVIGQ